MKLSKKINYGLCALGFLGTVVVFQNFTGSDFTLTQAFVNSECQSMNHQVLIDGPTNISATSEKNISIEIPRGCKLHVNPKGIIKLKFNQFIKVNEPILAGANQLLFSLENESKVFGFGDQFASVKWFGAKGDNKADDTTAFQKANAFLLKSDRATFYITKGTYRVGHQNSQAALIEKIKNAYLNYNNISDSSITLFDIKNA